MVASHPAALRSQRRCCSPVRGLVIAAVAAFAVGYPNTSVPQETDREPEVSASPEDTIQLNLPGEIELKVFVDLVSQQLGVRILHDERLSGKRLTVKAPTDISKSSLRGILESALRMKNLALVEAGEPGWLKIVEAQNLAAVSSPASKMPADLSTANPVRAVTQVFQLRHVAPSRVQQVIKPFLSDRGDNAISVEEQRILIVTDYAGNMNRIQELVDLVDRKAHTVSVTFIDVQHQAAADVAANLTEILDAQHKAEGASGKREGLEILNLERTNQLIVIAAPPILQEVERLAKQVDVPLGLETKVYRFTSASAKVVDQLLRSLVAPQARDRLYQAAVNEPANSLVVTTTPEIHARVESIKSNLDTQLAKRERSVRFYKLANATAAEVLFAIQAIEGVQSNGVGGGPGSGLGPGSSSRPSLDPIATSPVDLPEGLTPEPQVPAGPPSDQEAAPPDAAPPGGAPLEETSLPNRTASSSRSAVGRSGSAQGVTTSRGRIIAEPNTNSIVVVATDEDQEMYAELIRKLDRRRPQVLVEVTLVTLDTSGSFSLGVELSHADEDDDGDPRVLNFSSFGLSEVDPATGRLTLAPGLGFNGALISEDIADGVVRALATSGRAKVTSAPKILVNDNASGTLNSVQDAPFTSVNASNTVATTSFGGFENAGTTISVTPHISEGEHVRLEYSITLSTFTGDSGDGIPPPRQRNEVESEVTIPDGHTIVVGGLHRSDFSETITKVPILGDIPILGWLFSNRSKNDTASTLFVFIRPVILRQDQFEDLKFISSLDLREAGVASNYPASEPVLID